MQNLDNLNKSELQDLLKDLKLYRDLVKKVWNRGKKIYDQLFNWKNEYIVEYYSDLDEGYVYDEAKGIYKKLFDIEVKKEDIKFVRNDKILGWIKLYLNDSLIDMSFLKFYNLLKK